MNTRFIAYALFCTHMINGMDENPAMSPATTVRALGEELQRCVASGESLPKEVQELLKKLQASRSQTGTKKMHDGSCSPIMGSRGLKGHTTLAASRLRG